MATEEREQQTVSAPMLGDVGEPCTGCGAPLAHDQRYCLNCGRRRGGARLPVMERQTARQSIPPAQQPPFFRREPLLIAAAVGAFVLVLGLGVLIGSLASDDGTQQVAAAPTRVITVPVPAAGATAAPVEFTSDWPDGKDGYTVQLKTLPKDGTDVAAVNAAKSDAQSKGASDVGALDSDDFSSLDGGNYVVYAGVFDTRKQANSALKKLKKDFSGAKLIKVSAGGGSISGKGDPDALSGKKKSAKVDRKQLEELKKLSPEEYQKKSQKLPDQTELPGKAPKKDDKKPGGGSEGTEIG
jgi:hypothetical protein